MDRAGAEESYLLGHSERELARLMRQAGFFAEMTRDVLQKAGIGPGMRVLDVGCGAGDVSFILGDLVGTSGKIVGIDLSPGAIAIANRRAEAFGRTRVEFRADAMESYDAYQDFDAVIGRFILLHLREPAKAIARIARGARPGTTIVFCEMDLGTTHASREMPLLNECLDRIVAVYKAMGFEPEMGSKLHGAFRAAGLAPELFGLTRVADGNDAAAFDFLAESVRSLLPAMEKVGVATATEVGIDTLSERLAAEAATADACVFFPRFVGAWART
jgi:ubiquinone/menaquinone biosynthesis C-methylase UbiE